MFYIQVSFGPQKITIECKLWCQNSLWICMYQVTIEPHARVVCCELWYQMVCFYVLPLFVRSLHVAAFLWA